MKYKKINIIFFVIISLIAFLPKKDFAQEPTTYKMDFVRACSDSSKNGKNILTLFKVTPIVKDFKLVLSMRVFYQLEKEKEILSFLKPNEDNIGIVVYGRNVQEKNKFVYDFIKDRIDLEKENDEVYFIAFIFHNITKEIVEKMSITYGLWESDNLNVRHEKRYDFMVEQVGNIYFQNLMIQ